MGITTGKKKWLRKTTIAGPKYARNVDAGRYFEGVAEGSDGKLTTTQVAGSDAGKAYRAFADLPDSEKQALYTEGVRGKEDKWERNWLRAFGG